MWLGQAFSPASAGAPTLAIKLAPRLDAQGLVKAAAPHASPRRVLMIGRQPGRLIESDLVLNLSSPCQLPNTSWVQPGKMAWDHWWSGDVKMDTSTIKEYIRLAAEMGWPYQLIDWQWYGAFKTSGFNRTFPNQIAREGVLGNEYNRWSSRVTPEHKLTLPFTRFLAGPADFTPGGFLNRQPSQFKPDSKAAEVQGTRAAELTLFVAYDSPLCCVCDHPSHYEGQPGAGFLKIVPTVRDDTRVLQAEVAHHLLIARRSNQNWFLAGLTGSQARTDTFKLDFLKQGHWRLRLWKDAADSDVNAEHLESDERVVTAADSVTVNLAPAGGFAAWLKNEK